MALSKISNDMFTTISRPNAKPIIINGDMAVAQRGTSLTGQTASGYYTVDRMKLTASSLGTWTLAQEAQTSGNAFLNGFANAIRLDCTTADASPSAGDFLAFCTYFEGQDLQMFKKGGANAETFTLAFWVKSNLTGNAQVNLRDKDNTRMISSAYSISSADTWEHKILNFAADTTGAFGDDNGRSLEIEWTLDSGSNFTSGAIPTAWEATADVDRNVNNLDVGGSTSNDWSITGIQLEVGEFNSSTLPPFQHESFGANLERCQRYYLRFQGDASDQRIIANGFTNSTSNIRAVVVFPTTMRTAGTITEADLITLWNGGSSDAVSLTAAIDPATNAVLASVTRDSGTPYTAGQAVTIRTTDSTDSFLAVDAEL
jgi:hypothetical protein